MAGVMDALPFLNASGVSSSTPVRRRLTDRSQVCVVSVSAARSYLCESFQVSQVDV